MDSLWKVGRKRGWWRGMKGGDLLIFVGSLAVVNAVFERDGRSVEGGLLRRGISSIRGEGFRDRVAEEREREEAKEL